MQIENPLRNDSRASVLCTLCGSSIGGLLHRSNEEEGVFCCKGCQVVYQILEVQGALDSYLDHPVYRQALQSGLISNPSLLSANRTDTFSEDEIQKFHLTIQNMWCPSCAQVIHLIMMREKGVQECVVDYCTDLASIAFDPRQISKETIISLIRRLGYDPQFLHDPRQKSISRSLVLRFIVAAFFSLNVMMFSYPIYATYFDGGDAEGYALMFAWLSLGGALPVLFYSGWPIWRRCATGLRVGVWGMEFLVSMGVVAAAGLSVYELLQGSPYVYFDTLTVIISFVLLGKMIESKAKFSAKDALVKLNLALPRKGRIRTSAGDECFSPIKEIQAGDFLVVKMGEKIVLDGVVEEGTGACNESLMTGEQLPAIKQKGSVVLAGTVLQQGHLLIKVTACLEHTALHRIIEMVGTEIGHKSRYVRAADQIVKWFVPTVVGIALLTAFTCLTWGIIDGAQTVGQTAIIRAISVLLISCPCAIGIAAPLAESCLLNCLAKAGILVRNRGCLAFLGRETVFVLDKTGTVTEGEFAVCKGLEVLSFDEQRVLKALVAHSLHPIAAAIHHNLLCPPCHLEQVEEILGKGIRGNYQGQTFCIGSAAFTRDQSITLPQVEHASDTALFTTVYFSKEGKCLTSLMLSDQIRPGVKEFIDSLKPARSFLVSGDGPEPVAKVAEACRIDDWYASYHPLQKREMIDELRKKGEIVAMLGDGMNDAPALTAAHVGIAVVSASDMSVQVSDLLMTTKNFQSLVLLRQAAKKGKKIVNQNLFWAFFYNSAGIALAAAGMLTPLFAAFAMVASSLIVLANAQRLKNHTKGQRNDSFIAHF